MKKIKREECLMGIILLLVLVVVGMIVADSIKDNNLNKARSECIVKFHYDNVISTTTGMICVNYVYEDWKHLEELKQEAGE